VYKSWEDDFAAKQMRELPDEIKQLNGGDFSGVQPADLTEDQMVDLGFKRWSHETPMWLIPLWLFPFLADRVAVEAIDGEKLTLDKSSMDNDSRFGCLAYGVIPLRSTGGNDDSGLDQWRI